MSTESRYVRAAVMTTTSQVGMRRTPALPPQRRYQRASERKTSRRNCFSCGRPREERKGVRLLAPRRPHPVETFAMASQLKPLNIGMIGYGFMGRAHSNAYRKVNNFFDLQYRPVLQAICGRDEKNVRAFADKWGYESVETDWRMLIERKDIDAIDICTPNNTHKEIAIAAAKAGKMILCEKPLSMNAAEGEEMCRAVEAANGGKGVPNIVWYNYRR